MFQSISLDSVPLSRDFGQTRMQKFRESLPEMGDPTFNEGGLPEVFVDALFPVKRFKFTFLRGSIGVEHEAVIDEICLQGSSLGTLSEDSLPLIAMHRPDIEDPDFEKLRAVGYRRKS